jgi:hypothetical protein
VSFASIFFVEAFDVTERLAKRFSGSSYRALLAALVTLESAAALSCRHASIAVTVIARIHDHQ